MHITLLIPTYNECENIDDILSNIKNELTEEYKKHSFEILFIDNNSNDGTEDKLRSIAKERKDIKVILNKRNFGSNRSCFYGLMQVKSDAAIILPADLQVPINVVPNLINEFQKKNDVVLLKRKNSDEFFLMRCLRSFFYKIVNKFSESKLIENATGDGIYSKYAISLLQKFYDPYPFTRGLILEAGLKISTVDYSHQLRVKGKSSYNFMTFFEAGLMNFVKHSRYFLRLMIIIGLSLSFISFSIAIIYLIYKLLHWDTFSSGTAPVVIGLFGLGSFQLLLIGVLGEYLLTILDYTKKFPLVVEKERINFD